MKSTKQKEAILAAVCTMRNHPAADEIYVKLRTEFPNISLGTVYRNLNAFAENGDIKKVSLPNSGDRFDFRLDKHEHLLCSKCGKVFDINANVNIKMLEDNIVSNGYTLIIHGTCKNCAVKNAELQ